MSPFDHVVKGHKSAQFEKLKVFFGGNNQLNISSRRSRIVGGEREKGGEEGGRDDGIRFHRPEIPSKREGEKRS